MIRTDTTKRNRARARETFRKHESPQRAGRVTSPGDVTQPIATRRGHGGVKVCGGGVVPGLRLRRRPRVRTGSRGGRLPSAAGDQIPTSRLGSTAHSTASTGYDEWGGGGAAIVTRRADTRQPNLHL